MLAVLCSPPLSAGLHETLALLTSQLRPDSNHKEEMGFLKDVFSEKSLSYLMKVQLLFSLPCEGFWRSSELAEAPGGHPSCPPLPPLPPAPEGLQESTVQGFL